MAEAFHVPLIPTLDTPSTIIQGGCKFARGTRSGVVHNLFVAADRSGVIAALRHPNSSQVDLYAAGPSAFNLRIAWFNDGGVYIGAANKQTATNTQSSLKPYGTIWQQSDYSSLTFIYGAFGDATGAYNAIAALQGQAYIKYRLTNCSAPNAPMYAAPGQTVAVQLVIASGFQIMSPDDVYVENNGEKIPSSFVNNTITFVMP